MTVNSSQRNAPQPADIEEGISRTAAAGRNDRLDYLADMILEMQQFAQQSGCPTLAGILGLAHAEARQQSGRQADSVDVTSPARD